MLMLFHLPDMLSSLCPTIQRNVGRKERTEGMLFRTHSIRLFRLSFPTPLSVHPPFVASPLFTESVARCCCRIRVKRSNRKGERESAVSSTTPDGQKAVQQTVREKGKGESRKRRTRGDETTEDDGVRDRQDRQSGRFVQAITSRAERDGPSDRGGERGREYGEIGNTFTPQQAKGDGGAHTGETNNNNNSRCIHRHECSVLPGPV